jgi:hypothetical protein
MQLADEKKNEEVTSFTLPRVLTLQIKRIRLDRDDEIRQLRDQLIKLQDEFGLSKDFRVFLTSRARPPAVDHRDFQDAIQGSDMTPGGFAQCDLTDWRREYNEPYDRDRARYGTKFWVDALTMRFIVIKSNEGQSRYSSNLKRCRCHPKIGNRRGLLSGSNRPL